MRGLVQRVVSASVTVADHHGHHDHLDHHDQGDDARVSSGRITVGQIGAGLCVLVGVTHDDTLDHARRMAEKIWHLRVMDDAAGVMNLSVADTTKALLVISQFTLYGDTTGGRRPSWIAAARPEVAEPLVAAVVDHLRSLGAQVATGRFRAEMQVSLVNDGPVTLMVEV